MAEGTVGGEDVRKVDVIVRMFGEKTSWGLSCRREKCGREEGER